MDDFISELPDVLIHRIMSSLPFKDAIRTSVLSSRFNSVWRSFPILEFDIAFHNSLRLMMPDTFLQRVLDSLRNRPTNSLQKLRIRAHLNSAASWPLRDVIFSAVSSNIAELELESCDGNRENYNLGLGYDYCALPRNFFLFKSLSIFKVQNFDFARRYVVLDTFSTLKKLSITRCIGFNCIKTTKTTRLRVLEILECRDLKSVEIDAPNLESFEFQAFVNPFNVPRACAIRFTGGCKSLKNLTLTRTTFIESLFQENISICQMIENLKVMGSRDTLKCISFVSANLRTLALRDFEGLESIEISSQNLQSCVLDMSISSPCEITFSGMKFLKVLTLLSSEAVTGSWIAQNMFEFCFLEYLTLNNCSKLEWISLRLERIKNLNLINCNALMEVLIDAPKLDRLVMNLKDNIPTHQVILSRHFRVKLSLKASSMEPARYEDLKNFLVSFDHCKELTLDFSSNYDLVFPLEVREKMISPLYDVKHLKIEIGAALHNVSDLLSGLLWLAPFPETITFTSKKGDQSIQFQYTDSEVDETCSSLSYPVKCWKHTLKSIQLKNFKDTVSRDSVRNFFEENALRLESIDDDSETSSSLEDALSCLQLPKET